MRIYECQQRSEEWYRLRARPTCSSFKEFVTPARGDYAAGATDYAATIVAKKLNVYVEPPPSFWMQWGVENEPHAKAAYTAQTGNDIVEVGFIMPDGTDAWGGSPDGLIGDDGLVEIKCPAPETLLLYHAKGVLPPPYRPQVQGLLLLTERSWCDFFVWHPYVAPFLLRVESDIAYQTRIAEALLRLLEEITDLEEKLRWKI